MRSLLLALSTNRWLRERATKARFVRRAVRRFMPGEEFEDMLAAAQSLAPARIDSVFTRLGESVTDADEAASVTRHYLDAIDRVRESGLACEPSVKPTQLGLDLDSELCRTNLEAIAARAHAAGLYLWIDMEQSPYVDATLDLTRRVRARFPGVGVCLQAYLRRTEQDLAAMAAIGAGVRLVKGAYQEPESVAFPRKADVDANFSTLAKSMWSRQAALGFRAVFGTHDLRLIDAIRDHARRNGGNGEVEVHMLFGIQRAAQQKLVAQGVRLRVLIAYGTYWFPWYMRRLAERPANIGFLLRNLGG